jgi:serine/threonine protein kinase
MGLRPGDRFGRYELVSRLGHGGMAETWRARLMAAAGITKPALIKRILPEYASDDAFISMFISEAQISATLSHGNIAQVHDFGEVDGEYFLAMEYVDGQPLDRILKRARQSGFSSVPIPLATFIALEMCRGLHYAHTRMDDSGKPLGIVHRDISPDNVLVSYEGQVKLVDFGIAKARMQRNFNTAPGVVKGKYLYFSPEQARGEEVDGRTDVWATGIVLYVMVCGRLPAEGPEYAVLPKLMNGAFPRPSELRPDVPAELEALILKSLALNKNHRYPSSHAFGDALTGYLYSTTPRFSALSLSHFVQSLFREDLVNDGRVVHVPASFTQDLEQWRTPTTARSEAQAPITQPDAPPQVVSDVVSDTGSNLGSDGGSEAQPVGLADAPPEDTAPVDFEAFRNTRVSFYRRPSRRRSSRVPMAIAIGAALAVAAGVALAVARLGPDKLIPAWARDRFSSSPEATQPISVPDGDFPAPGDPSPGAKGDKPPQDPAHPPKGDGPTPSSHPSPSGTGTPPTIVAPPPEKPPSPSQEPSLSDRRAAWELLAKARALTASARFSDAEEVLLRCLQLDPHLGECRRLYANVLIQLGQPDRAREQMEQYLRTFPSERPPDLPRPYSGSQ